jgi:hypothetical protein
MKKYVSSSLMMKRSKEHSITFSNGIKLTKLLPAKTVYIFQRHIPGSRASTWAVVLLCALTSPQFSKLASPKLYAKRPLVVSAGYSFVLGWLFDEPFRWLTCSYKLQGLEKENDRAFDAMRFLGFDNIKVGETYYDLTNNDPSRILSDDIINGLRDYLEKISE